MTMEPSRLRLARRWTALPAALIPCAAFVVGLEITDIWVESRSSSFPGIVAGAPYYLIGVGVPSLLPLVVARSAVLRLVALVVMTTAATIAGVLAMATDDAQAGLAILVVSYVAFPLAGIVLVGQAIAGRRSTTATFPEAKAGVTAAPSTRLAALAIDVVIVGAALIMPLTALSHAHHELAAGVIGLAVATAYLGGLVSARGGTVGHAAVGLAVVDSTTMGRVGLARALVRGLAIAIELAGTATIVLAPPAIAELITAGVSRRSLTDRLLRTTVVTARSRGAKPNTSGERRTRTGDGR